MKELFEFYLAKEGLPSEDALAPDQPYLLSSMFTCMCLWYGLLFATCDGVEAGKVSMESIAPEYGQVKDTLRRFRNAMFHVQPDYWSEKLMAVLRDESMADTIRQIHVQVETWLRENFEPFERQASDKGQPTTN